MIIILLLALILLKEKRKKREMNESKLRANARSPHQKIVRREAENNEKWGCKNHPPFSPENERSGDNHQSSKWMYQTTIFRC
jgi:hypothetical protein